MKSYASKQFCDWCRQVPSQQRLQSSWWRRKFPPASSLTCCFSQSSSQSCWTQGRRTDHPKGKKLPALPEGAGELLKEQGGVWAKPMETKEEVRGKGLMKGRVYNAIIFRPCFSMTRRGEAKKWWGTQGGRGEGEGWCKNGQFSNNSIYLSLFQCSWGFPCFITNLQPVKQKEMWVKWKEKTALMCSQ